MADNPTDAQKVIADVIRTRAKLIANAWVNGSDIAGPINQVAAEIDAALGGLTREYITRHESGGGLVHRTLAAAEYDLRTFVVRPPGVDDPGSGKLTGIETRWASAWTEVP